MKKILGLDIGSTSIKLVEIAQDSKHTTLVSAGSAPLPPKALTSDLPSDQQVVSRIITNLLKETGAKARKVNIALPETQIFTRVIKVPKLSRQELASAIKWEAEQEISLPLEQVNLDYTVLRDVKETNDNSMEVLLVAAPKTLIEKYVSILDRTELDLHVVETELIAAFRSVMYMSKSIQNPMIVLMGAHNTSLALVHKSTLVFTRSLSAGVNSFIRAASQKLNIDTTQAQEYVRAYGLEKDKLDGKLVEAVQPVLKSIEKELQRASQYFQNTFQGEQIDSILLCGGAARLPGLVITLAESMGIETQLANPWLMLERDARFAKIENEAPNYTVAVGLALRDSKL